MAPVKGSRAWITINGVKHEVKAIQWTEADSKRVNEKFPRGFECSGTVTISLEQAMRAWPEAFVNAPGGIS